ncbi:MAG: ribosomal RNA small subunit methyltransferase A [Gemmatimonadales bacterium]|nr:MAG: ribosomal RNA small subunit methyltransferase A [Gemmatimonadales bacterium]
MSSGSHRPRGRAKRSLGQNFLVDRSICRRIVEAVEIQPGETVLEIGPGRGALTDDLAEAADRLVLVELDNDLAAHHLRRFAHRRDVKVIQGDILETDVVQAAECEPGHLRVVGNIPYNITTPILFHVLMRPRPADLHLMVQREVADRILAEPGGGTYGALSVGVRSIASVDRVLQVPRGAFRPRPRVDSTVIRVRPHRPEPLTEAEEVRLRRLVRAVFQWRRKQLGRTLRAHPDLEMPVPAMEEALAELGIESSRRPESLSPQQFIALSRHLPPAPEDGDLARDRGL